MAFRLPLDEALARDAAAAEGDASSSCAPCDSPSTAIIVHPLSMYSGGATSPLYSPVEWLRAVYAFQRDEVQQLMAQRQKRGDAEVEPPKPALTLLDCTCDENVRAILGFLDGVSLCRARRVNRYFHRLGDSDEFWLNLCKAEWSISPEQLATRPASFQELYKYASRSLKVLIRDLVEEQCLASLQASFRIPREAAVMITRGVTAV